MRPWKMYCTGLLLAAALAPAALAQGLPAITPPPGLAIAPQPPPVNAPLPPTSLPPNLWDKLCPRADQKAACKAKICNSALGKLLNSMLAPAGAFTGGILGPCCPTINAADLAKPADSAEGAAARVKLDEADAPARRAALRYMAGADCHYWPEVTEAMIGALRADRNECVRMEAALALGRGCCCNRATMMALTLSVSGGTEDGNPAEDSDRVRMAAMAALNHCLACYTEVVPAPPAAVEQKHNIGEPIPPKGEPLPPPVPNPGETLPPVPKTPDDPGKGAAAPNKLPGAASRWGATEFYHHPENLQEKKVVEQARRAVEHVTAASAQAPSPAADHSLFGIVRAAATAPPDPNVLSAVATEKSETHDVVVPATVVQKPLTPPVMQTPPPPVAPATFLPPAKTSAAPVPAPKPVAVKPAPAAAPVAAAPTIAPVVYLPAASKATVAPAPEAKAVVMKPAPAPKAEPTAESRAKGAVVSQRITELRESIYPEARQKAAEDLGGCEEWASLTVTQALIETARCDAAPGVRAACLRSLSRMNVRTPSAVALARTLQTDADPGVRGEAQQALQKMSGASRPQ